MAQQTKKMEASLHALKALSTGSPHANMTNLLILLTIACQAARGETPTTHSVTSELNLPSATISRALGYWHKNGTIAIEFDPKGTLNSNALSGGLSPC